MKPKITSQRQSDKPTAWSRCSASHTLLRTQTNKKAKTLNQDKKDKGKDKDQDKKEKWKDKDKKEKGKDNDRYNNNACHFC